jgi:predicted porin
MKKLLIAAAVLGACGGVQAQANVTIYGALDSYVEVGNNGKTGMTRVQSGGAAPSRIGFRGTEDLSAGLKALFILETGVNVDDGSAAQGEQGHRRC